MMPPTALIADDSRLARRLIRNALSIAGLRVLGEAENFQETVRMARQLRPDVITLDLFMPGMEGVPFIKEIEKAHPQGKILVVSSLGKLLQEDARQFGAAGFLVKPFLAQELIGKVGELLKINLIRADSGERAEEAPAASIQLENNGGPLTREQTADMMEVGNVGAGCAASRLSDLIYRRCLLNLPQVVRTDIGSVGKMLDLEGTPSVVLHLKVKGGLPATVYVFMKRVHAHSIVKHITKSTEETTGHDFSFTARFALKQMGDALTTSFADSIHRFLLVKAKYGMPEIIMGNWGSALQELADKNPELRNTHSLIHTNFFDPERTFEGKFVYALDDRSQQVILRQIERLISH